MIIIYAERYNMVQIIVFLKNTKFAYLRSIYFSNKTGEKFNLAKIFCKERVSFKTRLTWETLAIIAFSWSIKNVPFVILPSKFLINFSTRGVRIYYMYHTLYEKCSCLELLVVSILPYSDWILKFTKLKYRLMHTRRNS